MGIVFTLTNSVDSDKMLHCVAFHLGPHCQSTHFGVSSIQRVKVTCVVFNDYKLIYTLKCYYANVRLSLYIQVLIKPVGTQLTHLCLMEFPTVINWKNLFQI